MRVAVTGATGFIGHHLVAYLLDRGHEVLALGRRPSGHAEAGFASYDLSGPPPDFSGCDALVHAALSHVPGRYRGGEGEDPEGFLRSNLDGSVRLFEAARSSGVKSIVFLSSRAVYGAYPPGTALHEGLEPRPDTLYGRIKAEAEQALDALASDTLATASLRATGVYGPPVPGLAHKWRDLLADFAAGRVIEPRVATEVHARDLAEAIRLLLTADAGTLGPGIFNVSDILLDRRDLLEGFSRITGIDAPLPERADSGEVSEMRVDRLKSLGWSGVGPQGVTETLRDLATEMGLPGAR